MMKTVALVQARMTSSRLPGKVLMELSGRSVLSNVIRRVKRARFVDEVMVATTVSESDDPIVEEAQTEMVGVFRGSEQDVLGRYYDAARGVEAEIIVRITADCPLIEPVLIDDVILAYQRELPDYASNTLVRTYPRGLDVEVLSFTTLEQAWKDAREPWQRAHVTPYVYGHPEMFRLLSVHADENYSRYRWTLDTADDYQFLCALGSRLEIDDCSWRDIIALLEREPELCLINATSRQKKLQEE